MTGRRRPATAAGILLTLALGAPSLASWVVGGTGAVASTAGALGTPTAVTTSGVTESGLVLSWTAPSGIQPDGYVVRRNGSVITSCAAASPTATTCRDSGLSAGSDYSYTVTAVLAGWRGAASEAVAVTTAGGTPDPSPTDATPPTVSAQLSGTSTVPGTYTSSAVAVVLTADDGTGSGVASISYTVDGGETVTVTGASARVEVSGEGAHSVGYTAVDRAGNRSPSSTQSFTIDSQVPAAPTVSVPAYVNASTVTAAPVTVTGERDTTISVTANGTTGTVTRTAKATGTAQDLTLDLSVLGQGSVAYSVTATDAAGNTSAKTQVQNVKDTTAPTGVDIQAFNKVGGTMGRIESGDSLELQYSEALALGSVAPGLSATNPVIVSVNFVNGTGNGANANDSLGFTGAALGTVDLRQSGFVTGNASVSATLAVIADPSGQGRTRLRVTFTAAPATAGTAAADTMTWTPDATALDPAGNRTSSNTVQEAGGGKDHDF